MKSALIVCLLMLVVGIVLALSPARIGWFAPFAFCGTLPVLIAIGVMALCMVACLLMRRRTRPGGGASSQCRPPWRSLLP